MSTYHHDHSGHKDPSPKCDDCSSFDAEGFARHGRSWVPAYGAPCSQCGKNA